jgi:hypothetical protein
MDSYNQGRRQRTLKRKSGRREKRGGICIKEKH